MKDAYYFSHDSNARQDPKILEMISVYGIRGYGWYWILIEMLREQEGYALKINGKYSHNAFALQLHTKSITSKKFIEDCINEFQLFESDGNIFWSNSLTERMEIFDGKREKARQSANKRWLKQDENKDINANAMPTQCQRNASKVKESKVKESKEPPTPFNEIEKLYLTSCPLLPSIKELTEQRKTLIKARWQKHKDLSIFENLFKRANASKFLTGSNKENWTASFDWLLNVNNMVKVLEGNYDNKKSGSSGGRKYESY